MKRPETIVQSASFVAAGVGTRFRLVSEPAGRAPCGTVVFVPPFAEEMNKSRRMVARTARLLAAEGWRVVQRDLCGCGDSSGDFAAATWADWQEDVDAELALALEDRPVWLWCLRAGALLAPAAISRRPGVDLLLWHPVLSGAQHLHAFLRLLTGAKVVGRAAGGDGRSLLQRLRAQEAVEVAGYTLSPALAAGLEQATLQLPAAYSGRVVWLEVSSGDAVEPSPAASAAIEQWRIRGVRVDSHVLHGPSFWQTQEIEECEALLDLSRSLLAEGEGAAPHAGRGSAVPALASHAAP
jgi:exosortase A-associated hydrolase 2